MSKPKQVVQRIINVLAIPAILFMAIGMWLENEDLSYRNAVRRLWR